MDNKQTCQLFTEHFVDQTVDQTFTHVFYRGDRILWEDPSVAGWGPGGVRWGLVGPGGAWWGLCVQDWRGVAAEWDSSSSRSFSPLRSSLSPE